MEENQNSRSLMDAALLEKSLQCETGRQNFLLKFLHQKMIHISHFNAQFLLVNDFENEIKTFQLTNSLSGIQIGLIDGIVGNASVATNMRISKRNEKKAKVLPSCIISEIFNWFLSFHFNFLLVNMN